MFDKLKHLFTGQPSVTELPPADAEHALGALLVRAAKADDTYLFEELHQIDKILESQFNLNPVEAAKFRASCEKLEAQMPDTDELAGILQRAIPLDQRETCVATLWSVVFADGVEHEAEDRLLHQIEATLGIDPDTARRLHDAEQAKH